MKTAKKNDWLYALASILIGVLFVWKRGGVLGIAMTVLGVALIVLGVVDLTKKHTERGVVKLVLGLAVILCGWLFFSLALYVLAALLLVYGVLNLIAFFRSKARSAYAVIVGLAGPVICVLAAVCLLFHQGETVDWVFLATGILLIVQGALSLVKSVR